MVILMVCKKLFIVMIPLRSKQFYDQGVCVDSYKEYYEDGSTKVEGLYKKGLKSGTWVSYSETGDIINSTKYKKGEPVK